MPKHLTYFNATGNDTLIGFNVTASGDIKCKGDITIEGNANGVLEATGGVHTGVNSTVRARINADSIVIAGTIEGDINVIGEAIIKETGSVVGNITSLRLTIMPGGIFNGRSATNNNEGAV
jgi:cytoskeletal protein CcmA (bactofilin family)